MVLSEVDLDTKDVPRLQDGSIDPSSDDLYIPCTKGVIKHSYERGKLIFYSNKINNVKSVEKALLKKFPDARIVCEYLDTEGLIWFDDEDLVDKFSTVFRPKKSKEKIGPYGEIVYNEYIKKRKRRTKTNDNK